MPFPHTITRASAGSGKTFALSNRYLGLAHHGELPERILATTFARKAAGEILDRILIRLAEAVSDEAKRKELASFLVDGESLTATRCRELLRHLAGNLHKLRVGTIDSFFAQVARSFALELGVPPAWQIIDELEDVALRDEAIEAVLATHDESDLLQLVNLLTQGDAQRGVSQLLRDTVKELYQVYRESDAAAWEKLPRYKPLSEDGLNAALEDLRTLPVTAKALIKARDADYERAMSGDWKRFLTTGIAKAIVQGNDKFSRQPIEPNIEAVYEELINHAKAVLLGQAANFTIGARTFLSHFDEHYSRLKHRRRVMLFDDVTRAVVDIAKIGDAEGIAFRLDSQIDHLLLDEFQDTSPAQWTAIAPLAERIVERGVGLPACSTTSSTRAGLETHPTTASFYCVGDVKQAIYGWRGGVAEIFETVQQQLGEMHQESLDKSFRSSPVIIDTVNQVFQHLTNHQNLGRSAGAAAAFQKAFPPHATAKTELPGYACLRTAPADEDDQAGETLRYTARYIADLLKETPHRSIGVLCRTNKTIATLIYELRELGINASEEGGNPLTDSAAVQLILALLKLADHPGDTIARHHLATSVLGERLKLRNRHDEQGALRISQEVRRDLLEEGYGPTVYIWTQWLAPECNARELSRLKQLVELAYSYQASATLRTRDFIHTIEGQKVADPTAHPVRVTTIYRAKGLEFDIVVLPELDAGITRQTPKFIMHRDGPTGPIDCVMKYLSQDLQALLPVEFQQMFEAATYRDVTESMCVLYVALTRAVHALHMIIPPSSEKERTVPAKFSGLLRCALKDGSPVPAGETIWETGDPRWFEKAGGGDADLVEKSPSDSTQEPLRVQVAAPIAEQTRSLDRVAPSRMHTAKARPLAEIFADAENTFAKDRGSLIHLCFEQIQWLDDGPPNREALRRIIVAQASGTVPLDKLLDDFYAMLELGETPKLLSRPYYDVKLTTKVRCEYEFARINEGRLITGSIDRLALLYDGDKLAAADVIDFKTDTDIARAAKKHGQQLNAYRDAVSRIFKLPISAISARLLMVKEGSVIEIPPA